MLTPSLLSCSTSELGQLRTLRAALSFVRFWGISRPRIQAAGGPFIANSRHSRVPFPALIAQSSLRRGWQSTIPHNIVLTWLILTTALRLAAILFVLLLNSCWGRVAVFKLVLRLLKDDSGISSVEYAMLLAMAASGIIMSAEFLGSSVADQFADTASCFDGSVDANGGRGGGSGDGGGSGSGSGQGAGQGGGFGIC